MKPSSLWQNWRLIFDTRRPHRIGAVATVAAMVLGVIGLVVWSIRPEQLRWLPSIIPQTPDEPLAVLTGGVGILCVLLGQRKLGILAGLLLTSLGIWSILDIVVGHGGPSVERMILSVPPGHLGSAVALAVLGLGICLVLLNAVRRHSRTFIGEASGLVLIAFGLSGVIGHIMSPPTDRAWGPLTSMTPFASLGFLAIGTAIFAATAEPLAAEHRPLGLGTRVMLLVTSLTIIPIVAMAVVTSAQLRENALENETAAVAEEARLITSHLSSLADGLRADAIQLSNAPAAVDAGRATVGSSTDADTTRWRDRLADLFDAILRAKDYYIQIAYRTAGAGSEPLRIVRTQRDAHADGPDALLPTITLADHHHPDTIASRTGGFVALYALPADSAAPLVAAVLDAVMPVQRSGKTVGAVIVTMDVARVFESLAERTSAATYLTSSRGEVMLRFPHDAPRFIHPTDVTSETGPQIRRLGLRQSERWSGLVRSEETGDRSIVAMDQMAFDPQDPTNRAFVISAVPYGLVTTAAMAAARPHVELGVLFLLVSVALALSFSRTLLRPLGQMVNAVTAFGEGRTDIVLPTARRDETGALARAFQRMVAQVEGYTASLRREVAERTEAQHRLWDAAGTLEENNRALRAVEARFGRLRDANIIGICLGDHSGRLYDANDYFLNLIGHTRADLDAGLLSWIDLTPPEYVAGAQAAAREVMEHGACKPYETEYVRKDGGRVSVQVGVARLDENPVKGVAFVLDLTEQHQMRRELTHAQKMESIGQLAAGIAHEINTPTQYVSDNVRFLDNAFEKLQPLLIWYGDRLDHQDAGTLPAADALNLSKSDLEFLSGEIPSAIGESLEGLQRVASIVAAMKEFSHPGRTERSLLDLHQAIESTITVSRNEWKYVADVQTAFDDSIPRVPGLVGELNQVFLNLIVNAAQAIAACEDAQQKGTITISTKRLRETVEIRIADTGIGIPRDIRDRIFDPFFTTKEVGKGTGQGLAVARSIIIDKHRGTLRCESEPGRGATFIIRLPIEAAESASEPTGVVAVAEG